MKFNLRSFSKFIILLILFICKSNYAECQTGWKLVSTAINLNSVFFINTLNGCIAGDSGTILITYDGGMSWSGVNSNTKRKLNSVYFINEYTGYVAGNNGVVLKSVDGGENWTQLTTGVSYNLNSVFFPSADTGYAIGEKELRTTNGGISWTDYLLTLSSTSSYFVSNNTGFYTSGSNIFKTTNGGTAWFTTLLTGSFNSIYFENFSTGWSCGSSGIRYTTNTGANWTSQTSGAGFSTLFCINFSDFNSGWTVGSIGVSGGNSEIRRTVNAGVNWTGQNSFTKNILRSVRAVTSDQGVTAGDLGTILVTTNSGANWVNKNFVYDFPSNPSYSLNSVFFINENTGWTSGQLGIVNKTTDSGLNWTSHTSASFNSINAVHFLDKDTGWIAGASGIMQSTVNGGTNWTLNTIPVSSALNDIFIGKFSLTGFFGLYKIGWSVGNSGTILKTTNGGGNWILQSAPVTRDLYSVTAFSENNAVICGDSGTILKTTDGGITWSVNVSGIITGKLRSLSFYDNDLGICAGDSATVIYTTDQGNSWTADLTGPRSLTFENLNEVFVTKGFSPVYYAAGDGGAVISSVDGGLTWTRQSSGFNTKFKGIFFPADETGFICGTNGTVIKTSDGGVLPVELFSLTYTVNADNVKLFWTTSKEINNSGYYIERKLNNSDWKTINFVKGAGNSVTLNNYEYNDNNLENGIYSYRLKQVDFNGNFEYHNLQGRIEINTAAKYTLDQNYPNPFNPSTKIKFTIGSNNINNNVNNNIDKVNVSLIIYDITGKECRTLLKEALTPGSYEIIFNAEGLASGIYFYTLTAGNFVRSKSLLILK